MTALTHDEVPQPKSIRQHRFHALDAMRGVAAVLVVIYHVPNWLQKIVPSSYLVVDLFFVLSGFVIGYSYEHRLQATMSVRTFTLARIVRLYPLYLVGTLLGLFDVALRAFHTHDGSFLAQLPILASAVFFLPNLFAPSLSPSLYPLDGPAWSLFFEMVANIALAVLIRFRLAFSPVLLGIALVSLAWLGGTPGASNSGWSFGTFWPALSRVGYSFFVGVLLFRVHRRGVHPRLTGRTATTMMLVICALIYLCASIHPLAPHAHLLNLLATSLIFPTLVLVGAGCHVALSWQPLCNFLGDLSYPLYAIHSPTLYLIVLSAHFKRPLLTTFFSIALLALLLPASWWLGKSVDLPARKYLMAHLAARSTERRP